MWSWQHRYGELPTSFHFGPQFLGETGSYFLSSMPFAAIPRSAGLIFGVAVIVIRAALN